jgi:hypothetical protein
MNHFDENHFFPAERRPGARSRTVNLLAPAPHQVKSGSRLGIDLAGHRRPRHTEKARPMAGPFNASTRPAGYFAAAALLT